MGEDLYIKIATLWGPLSLFVGISYLLWKELQKEREKNRKEVTEWMEKHFQGKLSDIKIKESLSLHLKNIHATLEKISA